MKIMILAGTRPEVIKLAPVVFRLRERVGVRVRLCVTGQHNELLEQALDEFRLEPDIRLDVMAPGQTLAGLASRLFAAVDPVLRREAPDWVLVQGDTMTATAGALCAFYRGLRVGHVEAGLRTHDRRAPFPEEANRQIVSRVADLHFAPTPAAVDNLLREGIDSRDIVLSSNTSIDALFSVRDGLAAGHDPLLPEVRTLLASGKRLLLATCHRREHFGDALAGICDALADIARRNPDVFIFFPVHPNPAVREAVFGRLDGQERVLLADPMPYRRFVAHLDAAHLVLTDSGGVQEEAPALAKPVLVMRDATERSEGIAAGAARLVGTDRRVIVREAERLLRDPAHYQAMALRRTPYGDGRAAERIAQALLARRTEPAAGAEP